VRKEELLIREFILQLKTGKIEPAYFWEKFGIDVLERFADVLMQRKASGDLDYCEEAITLTRKGLLQVDRLLPDFFLPEHRGARYT
jgi:oxygen-independent coproporphyrinogen-3 oxidase